MIFSNFTQVRKAKLLNASFLIKVSYFHSKEKGISGGIVIIKGSDLTLEGNVFLECSKEEAKKLVENDKEKIETDKEKKEGNEDDEKEEKEEKEKDEEKEE